MEKECDEDDAKAVVQGPQQNKRDPNGGLDVLLPPNNHPPGRAKGPPLLLLLSITHPPHGNTLIPPPHPMDRLTQLQDAVDKLALLFVSSLDHLSKNAPLVALNPDVPVVTTGTVLLRAKNASSCA